MEAWRRAAHMWSWDSPGANADALAFWCAALGEPSEVSAAGGFWRTRWALCRAGSGEILGRHTSQVGAVATVVLPDGRTLAVTGSDDATVRIWDLTTGTPVGDPLTGHTNAVTAVATVVLPDGRPRAVTGSDDATVRIWDLAVPGAVGHPLHVTAAVGGVAMWRNGREVIAVIVGDGVALVDLEVVAR
jgi:WD40 repeat protein